MNFNFKRSPKFCYNESGGASAGAALAAAPAPNQTPAPTPAPPPAAAAAPAPTDWTSGLSEDHRGYVGNKGWKAPTDAIDSYRGLEKLLGAPKDRLMVLPERFYDDTGKLTAEGRAVRERQGAPKDAKEYDLKAPKEGGDPKLLEHFRGKFHELGITKTDAEKITGSWNEYAEAQMIAQKEVAVQTLKDQSAKLQKEWGAAFDQNVNIAREAAKAMGTSKEVIDAFASVVGHDKAMQFFCDMGKKLGEAPFIGGTRQNLKLEPSSALSKYNELKTNPEWVKRFNNNDPEAIALRNSLLEQAYPGEYRVS